MSKAAAKKGSKESLWAPFLKGTDYGIRRTAKGEWYVRKMTKRGTEWIRADKAEVKHYLEAEYCLCSSSDDETMSDADRAMLDALSTYVEFAGAYAGYREPGEIAIGDDTVLITRGIRLIAPEAGDCSFVRDVIRALFPTSHTETITKPYPARHLVIQKIRPSRQTPPPRTPPVYHRAAPHTGKQEQIFVSRGGLSRIETSVRREGSS